MSTVQAFLFNDGSIIEESGANTHPSQPTEMAWCDNVFVQDLVDTGIWSDLERLEEARESLRVDVMESSSDPHGFFSHESKVALKMVSERLHTLRTERTYLA